jgi:hypothetical protein
MTCALECRPIDFKDVTFRVQEGNELVHAVQNDGCPPLMFTISGPPDEESAHQQPPAPDASKWVGFPIFLAMLAETATGTFCDRSWGGPLRAPGWVTF